LGGIRKIRNVHALAFWKAASPYSGARYSVVVVVVTVVVVTVVVVVVVTCKAESYQGEHFHMNHFPPILNTPQKPIRNPSLLFGSVHFGGTYSMLLGCVILTVSACLNGF